MKAHDRNIKRRRRILANAAPKAAEFGFRLPLDNTKVVSVKEKHAGLLGPMLGAPCPLAQPQNLCEIRLISQ